MRSWSRWAILIVVLVLSASVARPARASFSDCDADGYMGLFDERLADVPLNCVERVRIPVNVSGGTRHIRIVHDINVDWAAGADDLAQFESGIRTSADAIRRLGDIQLNDITVLLADDFPPPEGEERFSNIAGWARTEDPSECRVIVYLAGATPANAQSTVAHELFHCVQAANLSEEQMNSGVAGTGEGGDWWMEGSAEWFAFLAFADAGSIPGRITLFDEISSTVPLNRMAYAAVVFFSWLGSESSPAGIIPFLRSMAASNDESAQRAAMMAALPQDRWLNFAQAYLDRTITDPHGRPLAVNPTEGEVWEWSATQTRTARIAPFLLHRGVLAYQCGRWRTGVTPSAAHRARPEDGGDWSTLPVDVDTTSGSGGAYRFVAMNSATSEVALNVRGTMEAGCGDCAGVRTTDSCVVGIWQLTGGGPAEWLRSQGVPGNMSVSNALVHFRADGTFVTSIANADLDQQMDDDVRVQGETQQQATGRWSTSEGRLNMCQATQSRAGEERIITPRGTWSLPATALPPGTSTERYTCARPHLYTEREMTSDRPGAPAMPPMPFNYTRIGD